MAPPKGKKLEPTCCGLCSFSSKRIVTVERHIQETHDISAKQLYDNMHGGPTMCKCGCNKETRWLNWKNGYSSMIIGHNANIYAVYDTETALKISKTRGSNWRNKPSIWQYGISPETDAKISARGLATSAGRKKAFDDGNIVAWNKGLTKETDTRVADLAANIKQEFMDGTRVPWAKGLSKDTDTRIAAMADKVSLTHKSTSLRTRLDELKKLNETEIRLRVEATGKLKIIGGLSEYVNDATPNIHVECTTCKNKSYGSLRQLQFNRCYECDPAGSAAQADIAAFIAGLGIVIEKNVRNIIMGPHRGAELDIYVPEHKLAIEYNGLYWHNNLRKTDEYHQNKSNACHEIGVTLSHVFEDEWRDKKEIVSSMISHNVGLTQTSLGARKCLAIPLSSQEKRKFFNENHIDSDTASTHAIGLKHDDEIIMALSLRRPFHKKHKNSIEVARVATKTGVAVAGGLGKLTAKACLWASSSGYAKLISYVDTRFGSDGSNWVTSGWTRIGETPPRFWWTDNHNRFNRFKFKADKRKGLSEAQVAAEAGVVRIYGCKNLVFEIDLNPALLNPSAVQRTYETQPPG